VDNAQIGAIFAGLASVVTAVGGVLLAMRQRGEQDTGQLRADRSRLRREVGRLRGQLEATEGYVFDLTLVIRRGGLAVPPRPEQAGATEDLEAPG
jgi:hypothetical protein